MAPNRLSRLVERILRRHPVEDETGADSPISHSRDQSIPIDGSKRYIYTRLPSDSSFRYIELLPGRGEEELAFQLRVGDWDRPPSYAAISYAWGDPKDRVWVRYDGGAIHIPSNLHAGLLQLRRESEPVFLWADSLCIDQNTVEERNHQVNNMRKIFGNARQVTVWLGRDLEECAERAMDAMKEITQKLLDERGMALEALGAVENLWEALPTTIPGGRYLCKLPEYRDALKRFFENSWFRRLWVLQEVNSSLNIQVCIGRHQISWDAMGFAAVCFRSFTALLPPEYWGDLEGPTYMRARERHKSESMLATLHCCRSLMASDSRDHVYAILGMPSLTPLAQLQVEYQKSHVEVFRDVVHFSLRDHHKLDALSFVQHIEGIPKQGPSWVPLWNEQALIAPLIPGNPPARPDWAASRGTEAPAQDPSSPDTLVLRGACLDTIRLPEYYGDFWFQRGYPLVDWSGHPLLNFIRGHESEIGTATSFDDKLIEYGNILCLGIGPMVDGERPRVETMREPILREIAAYIVELMHRAERDPSAHTALMDLASGTTAFEIERRVRRMILGRSVFTTLNGRRGAGRKLLRRGDKLCVLFGGDVLYILREKGDRQYQFVGDAYMPGFMYGEAMDMLAAGQLKEEIFSII